MTGAGGRLARLRAWPASDWADLVQAVLALGPARLRLRRFDPRHLATPAAAAPPLSAADRALAVRVGRAVARAARLVPWRSDCLVQALAAKGWLARAGLPTRIELGTRRDAGGAMLAHAWLLAGDLVVTGGDVAAYVPFRPA